MTERKWKYRREDFGELPVVHHHLTIHLNFLDGVVEACNTLEMTARIPMDRLELDASSLTIVRVEAVSGPDVECGKGGSLSYDYLTDRNKLIVLVGRTIPEGERFCIRTITRCTPSDHILEGIYKDVTPPGAPQQYISQCQQWGFQRIMPIFDDCRAKCTMRTTIEADARYTHLISNGNIDRGLNPDGKPVPKPGDPGRQVITFENPIPMAPYLFLVCAGTWDVLADEVVYDTGGRVRLEYLVPPGSVEGARVPMEILKESVLWVKRTQDYEYTGDTYRTICMSKSNFGGMENVGNTTIVTDAALIHGHTLDASLLYAHAVIVHEFEHNQCGSETTMDTPFDVWLNEAYTVDVERQFMADLFDPGFVRLNQLESIRNPLLGPLAIEDAGHAGRIVREGFNDPDELIDGVTYVKAAEVIRMLRLVIGEKHFKAGKTLYFTRYRHGNATTDQFFQCFEETSGVSLEQFKKGWLYTIGYPSVTAKGEYDPAGRRYHISFRQSVPEGLKPFHLPIELALVDEQGRDMAGTAQIFQMRDFEAELVIEDVSAQPAFASMNRNASFYGTFRDSTATPESLRKQARRDPNPCNRLEAMRQLIDWERIKLLEHTAEVIDPDWLVLYGRIIEDRTLPAALKAYFLRIDEQPLDREYVTWVRELVLAREKLMLTVNRAYRDRLLALFSELDTYNIPADASPRHGIEDRLLKQVLLDLITVDDSPESHQLILEHFRRATMANDRVAALLALNRSSSPARGPIMEEVYKNWVAHLSGYANYLRVVSSGTCDDVFDRIAEERNRPTFDVNIPTWSRALFLPMAANNKMVWTDRGIRWLVETIIELAPLNATTTSRLLNTFQHVNRLKPELREKVRVSLERVVNEVSESASPTIHGQARAYLGR
jgi:aminopeptidase N